ncbi:MAG: 4-hydroxythreonine-4-phosphate dehydrogenase PdxA, partial [Verrucomicrobiota bacterium]
MTLGLTLGDVTGIGPEVAGKALARAVAEDDVTYVLIGDSPVVHHLCGCLGVEEALPDWSDRAIIPSRVYLHAPEPPLPPALPPGDPAAALAALAWLREAARMALGGELDALVTAPVNKEAILRAGHPFVGQTEFLAALAGNPPHAMMLLGHDPGGRWLRVVLVT